MQYLYERYINHPQFSFPKLIIFLITLHLNLAITAQCPPNIDFENGSFDGWTCYIGSTGKLGTQNIISISPVGGPVNDYHTMYSAAANSNDRDYYGNFPVVCPNGSGYSVKVGNNRGGTEAEGISYDFTIPDNRNTFSLIYHYAVVFQDPNHFDYEQPRLVLEIMNVTDNKLIDCSSFTFFPNGSALPGFFLSPNSDSTGVWCKNWSAVTINLNNMAGKAIRLFFKTADCTFRRHFGYAYIDVNTECSDEFVGATYCRDDTAVNVVAPFGYQNYTWYNSNFSKILGNTQELHYQPPPPVGTLVAVEIVPYNGYGCLDTLYARLIDTLTLKANAGSDKLSCNGTEVLIGSNAKPGIQYNWSPVAGLSNTEISNPRAGPLITTDYILTVRNSGGGCVNSDTVRVLASVVDSTLQLLGRNNFCSTSGDSAVLTVKPIDNIQWFRNNVPISGETKTRFRANQTGNYYASLSSKDGCKAITRTEEVYIETPRPGTHYPPAYAIINSPIQLDARPFGNMYLWRPPVYLDKPAVRSPFFSSPLADEEFFYTVNITTTAGCLSVDTQIVKTIKEVKVFVPSGFTPNNDGLNDLLYPVTFGEKELQYFRIFNRWGQLVYEIKGTQRGWNGTINNIQQATGTYVWIVQVLGLDNKIHTKRGTTTLIR